MEGDASTPPSRARLALAWRVGLRPGSRRLVPALGCLALAAAIPARVDPALAAELHAVWGGGDLGVLQDMFLKTWASAAAIAVGLALAAAAGVGALGWVEGDRRRLGRVGRAGPGFGAAVAGAAVLVVLALAVRGVIAGAARGVDAGEAGLVVLWVEWLRRVLLAAGLLSLAAAVVEVLARRAALRGALYQTRSEAKERGA